MNVVFTCHVYEICDQDQNGNLVTVDQQIKMNKPQVSTDQQVVVFFNTK